MSVAVENAAPGTHGSAVDGTRPALTVEPLACTRRPARSSTADPEPGPEQPAREEPADRDDRAQPDPVQETAEELLEPADDLADDVADGSPVDPPPLPG